MKLTVWIGHQDGDGSCYNVLEKTKSAAMAEMVKSDEWCKYSGLYKVRIEAKSMFDLFEHATSEGGGRHPCCWDVLKKWEGDEFRKMLDRAIKRSKKEE